MSDDIVKRLRAELDDANNEIERLRADLAKMDSDARWAISDLEHDLTDMRLRAEAAEAELNKLKD